MVDFHVFPFTMKSATETVIKRRGFLRLKIIRDTLKRFDNDLDTNQFPLSNIHQWRSKRQRCRPTFSGNSRNDPRLIRRVIALLTQQFNAGPDDTLCVTGNLNGAEISGQIMRTLL